MIICGADVYSLRYRNSPDKCVSIAGATAEELIAIENDIVYRCSIAENDRVYTNRCQCVGMVWCALLCWVLSMHAYLKLSFSKLRNPNNWTNKSMAWMS